MLYRRVPRQNSSSGRRWASRCRSTMAARAACARGRTSLLSVDGAAPERTARPGCRRARLEGSAGGPAAGGPALWAVIMFKRGGRGGRPEPAAAAALPVPDAALPAGRRGLDPDVHVLRLLARTFDVTALCFERAGTAGPGTTAAAASREALGRLADVEVFEIPQRTAGCGSRGTMRGASRAAASTRRTSTNRAAFRRRLEELLRSTRRSISCTSDSLDLAALSARAPGSVRWCACTTTWNRRCCGGAPRRAQPLAGRAIWRHQARLMDAVERHWCERVALNVAVSESDDRGSSGAGSPGRARRRRAERRGHRGVPAGRRGRERASPSSAARVRSPTSTRSTSSASEILPHLARGRGRRARALDRPGVDGGAAMPTAERYGVELTGYIDDVRPLMRDAACHIVPLRVGGGHPTEDPQLLGDGEAGGHARPSDAKDWPPRMGRTSSIRDEPGGLRGRGLQVLLDGDAAPPAGRGRPGDGERLYSWEVVGAAHDRLVSARWRSGTRRLAIAMDPGSALTAPLQPLMRPPRLARRRRPARRTAVPPRRRMRAGTCCSSVSAGHILTGVGRVHQLFTVVGAVRPAIITGLLAIVLYFHDPRRGAPCRTAVVGPTTKYLSRPDVWMVLSIPGALVAGDSFDLVFNNFVKTALMCARGRRPRCAGVRDVERLALAYLAAATVYAGVVITALRPRRGFRLAPRTPLLLRRERLRHVRRDGDAASASTSSRPGDELRTRLFAAVALVVLTWPSSGPDRAAASSRSSRWPLFIVLRYSAIPLREAGVRRRRSSPPSSSARRATSTGSRWARSSRTRDYNRTDESGPHADLEPRRRLHAAEPPVRRRAQQLPDGRGHALAVRASGSSSGSASAGTRRTTATSRSGRSSGSSGWPCSWPSSSARSSRCIGRSPRRTRRRGRGTGDVSSPRSSPRRSSASSSGPSSSPSPTRTCSTRSSPWPSG